jgi:hypothetical protein
LPLRERASLRCSVHPGACNGAGSVEKQFDDWREALAKLPRRQTRVLTSPLATVFGFIAQRRQHIFLKPMVTQRAATRCDRVRLCLAPRRTSLRTLT